MAGIRTTFRSEIRTRSHTNSPRNAPPPSQLTIPTGKLHQQQVNSAKSTKFWKRGCSEGYFRYGWSLLVPVTWRQDAVTSGDRSQFSPSPANRAYTVCLYYCPTSSISALFGPKTMDVHNTWISYVNKSVSVAGFSAFVCIINNQILCPVQGKQCVHLKFSDNY